jgi:hypothetical protein
MLWFEQGWNGGDCWIESGDVVVMLKSAKDRVLGVDISGQRMPPRVWYKTTCLLIRDVVGSVSYSNEWKIGIVTHLGSHGAREAMVPRLPQKTLAMLWYCVLP